MQIKGKLNIKGVRPNWSLIFGDPKRRVMKKRGEEKRRKKKVKKAKKGMETKIFVWFVWIVMGWYEFVDFYMNFLLELGFEVLKSVITC